MDDDYVPFSQRNGLAPVPPQLELGEVSDDLRRLLLYALLTEMQHASRVVATNRLQNRRIFNAEWARVSADLRVKIFKLDPGHVAPFEVAKAEIEQVVRSGDLGDLFDLIEFLLRHRLTTEVMKAEIAAAFVQSRAAYRVVDEQIVAIGNDAQADAFLRAVSDADAVLAKGARQHLIDAGLALRRSDWAGCVRDSIHAVEAAAIRIDPTSVTLGAALKKLEAQGRIHGALKSAFERL